MPSRSDTEAPAARGETITRYKGRELCLYHPNRKGTGSALRIEPRINRDDRDRYNCVFLELAAQKPGTDSAPGAAAFDWAGKLTVKLGFPDLTEILSVLEGRAEAAGGGSGLYHAGRRGNVLITCRANRANGTVFLGVSAKHPGMEEPKRIGFVLSPPETVGLRTLLQTGLFFITFPALFTRQPERGAA